MTAPLQGKRHRVELLISPAPWVAVRRETGVDEDGEEFVVYKPAHASLFFVAAASLVKPGKTLAICDADAGREISRNQMDRSWRVSPVHESHDDHPCHQSRQLSHPHSEI